MTKVSSLPTKQVFTAERLALIVSRLPCSAEKKPIDFMSSTVCETQQDFFLPEDLILCFGNTTVAFLLTALDTVECRRVPVFQTVPFSK